MCQQAPPTYGNMNFMNSAVKTITGAAGKPFQKLKLPQKVLREGFENPSLARRLFNLWPPLLGAGVRITHVADDWSAGRLELNLRWWNRNMHGAGFGGTLFSMTDVLFGTLVMGRLGSDYEAWTRTGTFQYLSPGRRGAYLDVEVTDELLAWMKEVVAEDGYCNVPYTSVIYNKDGSVAGIGQQDLHVRPRRSGKLAHLKRAPEPKHATEARGLVLESLANAVLWHCFKEQPSVLTSLMSRQRRIPQPDEQMRMVVREVLDREAATREELLELGVAEKFLG